MEIRAATAEDSVVIGNLVCRLSEKYISNEFTPEGKQTLLSSMTPAAIKSYIQSGYRYHVAEVDNQLVGVVGVKDNTHLYHLFVAEDHHRQGIASRLWQVAVKACMGDGNPGEFTVNSSIYAVGAYESLGFVAQSGPKDKNGVLFIPMKLTRNQQ